MTRKDINLISEMYNKTQPSTALNKIIYNLEDASIDENTPAGRILHAMQNAGVMDLVEFETAAVEALEQAGHPQVEDLDANDIRELISKGLSMRLKEKGDQIMRGAYSYPVGYRS